MSKIQDHWKIHKTKYLIGGGMIASAGVGVGVGLVLNNKLLVKNQIIQILSWKPSASLEVYIEALGDPGNVIQDMKTGSVYASQGQAARELGLSPSRISDHLNGRTDHVGGHVFKKIGKAAVAE